MPGQADSPPVLEVCGVTKYFGRLAALNSLSFTLREGDILGIIGPNGAGKTTLVNLITGHLAYSAGDIRFLGASIRGLKPYQVGRLGISRAAQIVQPFDTMTTLENVMVGALFGKTGRRRSVRAARKQAEAILEILGMTAKRSVPGASLNVADRKRLERGRALAMLPKLLLLDEVMAGLNPAEIDEAVGFIKRVRETGVTLLVIEHVLQAIANVSDRILVLHHGEKIIEDVPDVVLHDQRVIEAYLGKRYSAFTQRGEAEPQA